MSFYMRNYASEEQYDIAKFLDYKEGVFDVVGSPFLAQLSQLSTEAYYNVDEGFKEIDLIATDYYGDQFFAYLIQYYNGDFRETFPEGTVLNMFSATELEELFYNLSISQNLQNKSEV